MCSANLHGCAVIPHNRTYRRDAPHAAEQMAAPIFVSDLCRSSAVSPPSTDGIGVRVLPASAVLISNGDACAFLAQQEKPEVLPVAGIIQKEISIFFRTRPEIPPFCTLDFVVATIVAMKI